MSVDQTGAPQPRSLRSLPGNRPCGETGLRALGRQLSNAGARAAVLALRGSHASLPARAWA